jgi:two-component system sensor histidine kinase HydH
VKPKAQEMDAASIKSLAWRLTLPIMFVGLLMTAFGISAAVYVHWEYRARSEYVTRQVSGQVALQDLMIAERDLRYKLREFLLKGDVAEIDAAILLIDEVVRLINDVEKTAVSEQGMQLIVQIREGEKAVREGLTQVHVLPLPAMRQEVLNLVNVTMEDRLLKPTREYSDVKHQTVRIGLERTEQFAQILVITMTILGLCGATAGVLWGLAAARGIGRSLVELTVPIKNAAGQLSEVVGPLTVHSHWDFNELPIVVDQMAVQVGEVIEQMRASERRALRSEQLAAVGQLSAGMAHELRNPLTSMKLIVQKARTSTPGTAGEGLTQRELEILEEEIDRLERVVGGILDYARPPQAHFNRIDLVDVIQRSVELVADRFRRRGVQLDVELPNKPHFFSGDPSQLRQVLLNLLLNALDMSEPGKVVRIRYRAKQAKLRTADDGQRPGDMHVVEVVDQGAGLPKDPNLDIFEPFVSTKETGLGLGLSISRRIVEAHHGFLEATNGSNGGAVFRIELPVAGTSSAERSTPPAPEKTSGTLAHG